MTRHTLRRWLDLTDYYAFIDNTEREHPDCAHKWELYDHDTFPVVALEISEFSVPAEQKQHVLLTAMHSGVEYSGANSLMAVIRWLVGEDPAAETIRKCMRIVIVPVPNPYSYDRDDLAAQHVSLHGGDPYSGPWTLDGVREPETNVEAAAIQRIMDELAPDLYVDCHGVFLEGQHMIENTGISVFGMNRPHHDQFIESMNAAAEAMGYYIDTLSMRQKTLPIRADVRQNHGRRYLFCADAITPGVYAYHNFHTLSLVMEIGEEMSGFVRLRAALEGGLRQWPGEPEAGFPVNRIYGEGLTSMHPHGNDHGRRRHERVAMWNALESYSVGTVQPQIPGQSWFLTFGSESASALRDAEIFGLGIDGFAGLAPRHPLARTVDAWPEGTYCSLSIANEEPDDRAGIFAIGVRAPFRNVRNCTVRVNGDSTRNRHEIHSYGPFSLILVYFENEPVGADRAIEVRYDHDVPPKIHW